MAKSAAAMRPAVVAGTVLERTQAVLAKLTPREARAASHLIATYPMAGLSSIGAFAKAAGVSAQSILRFIAKLGFAGYGAFQAALKHEVAVGLQSPLDRLAATSRRPRRDDFLGRFAARIVENMTATFAHVPRADFERAAKSLAEPRRRVQVLGGRFTQTLAHYLALHLDIVRGNVLRPDPQVGAWPDRLADLGRQDVVVLYDIRRYAPDLARFAQAATGQGAEVILLTDAAQAPAAAHAKITLAAEIGMEGTWDSSAALLALTEALIARVSELAGPRLQTRLATIEALRTAMR
ncbi:MurR/RpiR family transcriptional regulator [Oleomonas cavernae]|nr:MurR/RpiR family transcriptional regulator [Oleomonas cavernae]